MNHDRLATSGQKPRESNDQARPGQWSCAAAIQVLAQVETI
jgi:hypothetical protein